MKGYYVKIGLLTIILSLFFMPIFQKTIGLFKEPQLYGHFHKEERPKLNPKAWFDGSFQDRYDTYIRDNIGFNAFFIRVFNQVNFSLYKTTNTKDVAIGKNKYLYSINNYEQYFGIDTLRSDLLEWRAIQLERIAKRLKQEDIDLILVLAPSKAGFLPDYFPDDFTTKNKDKSSYKTFVNRLKDRDVNCLDLSGWFIENREDFKYNIFSNTGVHWSQYGIYLVADSLLRYSEEVLDYNVAKIHLDSVVVSTKLRGQDDDIERSMNLIFDIKDIEMPYPILSFETSSDGQEPEFLIIGDSYYWDFYTLDIPEKSFNNAEFWYYFNEVHEEGYGLNKIKDVDKEAFTQEFSKKDIIVILSNDANFYYLTRIISEIYEGYFPNQIDEEYYEAEFENRVDNMIMNIKKTPEWYDNLKQQAIDQNLSLDEVLRSNAIYVINTESND